MGGGEFGRLVAELVGLQGLARGALLEGLHLERLAGNGQQRAGVGLMPAARGRRSRRGVRSGAPGAAGQVTATAVAAVATVNAPAAIRATALDRLP